jgi:hypothetical protein
LGRWIDSMRGDYLVTEGRPWITFDATEWLDKWLPVDARVFEYGSGGSTLFWLARGARCVSVEHDAGWFDQVRARVPVGAQVDLRLVPPERDAAGCVLDPSDPDSYRSGDAALRTCSFHRYVSQIDEFPDEAFDIVFIDGRARPSCIKHSVPKVRRGGLLVLDNADREYYLQGTSALLREYDRERFHGVGPCLGVMWSMWATDVFTRR